MILKSQKMGLLNLFKKKIEVPKKIEVGTLLSYRFPNNLSGLYFQVIEVKGKFCTFHEIEKEVTSRSNGGWDYYTKPKANAFITKLSDNDKSTPPKPIRKMIKIMDWCGEYVELSKHERLYIWRGKPEWNSSLD